MTSGGAPAVSVVIPVYNGEKTLRACLESVYSQSYPPAEVIVVDDASTDRSADIARDYPCFLIELPVNRGPSAARNRGVTESKCDILFFVDSDGALASDAIRNAIQILLDEPDVGCVHGIYATRPLFDDGPIEAYRILHGHYWRARSAGRVPSAYFALCAIRRAVFDDVGLFDENLRVSEDDEFSDRMRVRYLIVLTPAISGRHDDDSRLVAMLRKQFMRSQLLIPVAMAERGPGGLRANRPLGLLAAGLTMATAPLWLIWPVLALVPAACLAVFALADPGLCRFVAKQRGPRFLLFFMAVHFLIQLSICAGAAMGGLRRLVDPGFGPARPPEASLSQ